MDLSMPKPPSPPSVPRTTEVRPDPINDKRQRRVFSPDEKLRILDEHDRCKSREEVGALLRRARNARRWGRSQPSSQSELLPIFRYCHATAKAP